MNRYDNEPNPLHAAEREEHRHALHTMNEQQRHAACTHHHNRNGHCVHCGHTIKGEL